MGRRIPASAPSTGKAAAPGASGGKNLLPDNTTWSLVALEHAPVGVVMINEAGRIVAFNAAAERIFRYDTAEVAGQPVGILVADHARDDFDRTWRRYLQEAGGRANWGELEARAQRKGGGEFPVEVSFSLLEMDGCRYLLGFVRDVTDRKQAEELLERYRLLASVTRDIILFVRRGDGRIIEANQAAEAAYGYSRDELLSLTISDLRDPVTHASIAGQMARADAGGVSFETVHRRRDGRSFPVEVSSVGTEIAGERVLLSVIRDITQRQRWQSAQALLHEIDQRLLGPEPLDGVLQFLCEGVARLFDAALVMIAVRGSDGAVNIRARAGTAAHNLDGLTIRWDETALGGGPTGTAIRTSQPQSGSVAQNPTLAPWHDALTASGLSAYLSLPLVTKDQTLGALSLYTTGDAGFDEESTRLLTAFADQVAISLQAATHLEQIRLLTAALESAANGVVITDRQGRIKWVNPAFTSLTGYGLEEASAGTPRILRSGYQSPAFYRQLWETILAGEVWKGEVVNRRKDGTLYIEEMTITPVRDDRGEISNFIAIMQDITERKRQEEQVRYLAMHDAMTGLFNRRGWSENLALAVERARAGEPGALLMLDIDDLKLINDTEGHQGGDQVLVAVTNLLRRVLRPQDFAARIGGDEIAVLLRNVSPAEVQNVAERLRQAVCEHHFQINGHDVNVTVSIGVAVLSGTLETEAVQSLADAALYAAKEGGKNKVVFFQSEHGKRWQEAASYQVVMRLKEALQEGRLELHFQPVVSLRSKKPSHYEALVRMRDDQGTLVYPKSFIQAAERFGLISQVDRWVVRQALETLSRRPDLRLFVNLSGASLGDGSLLRFVEEQLQQKPIQPGQLAFEVTETALIKDLDYALPWVLRLRELGCLFALDDFGIGFSSFSYLRTLPVDYVKIDGSFVRDLDRDPTNQALVRAMNDAAHTLGMKVIAEWVESETVESLLRELGVDYGQGYRWGQPSPSVPSPGRRRIRDSGDQP